MIGESYHEYIEFDDGTIFSFAPTETRKMFNDVSMNVPESGVGAVCTEYSKDSSNDAVIKAQALKNLIKPYKVNEYNCKDFVKESMTIGK